MATDYGKKRRKIRWIVGDQSGRKTVSAPSTMRNARRGVSGRKHRTKTRSR